MFLLGLPQAVIGHMCSSCRGAHARVPHHSVARSRLGKLILARPENVFFSFLHLLFSPGSSSAHRAEPLQRDSKAVATDLPLQLLMSWHNSCHLFQSFFFFNMYQLNISFLTPTCVFLTRAIMPFCCVLSMETEFHRSLFGYKRFTQNLPS